jgi:hypothetical protein
MGPFFFCDLIDRSTNQPYNDSRKTRKITMSDQLHRAMQKVLAMPYHQNHRARSGSYAAGHEAAVADVLNQEGFTEVSSDQFPGLTKSLIRGWLESDQDTDLQRVTQALLPGSYVLQPAGSQSFPDILLRDHTGQYFALECKSCRDKVCPMWNDSLPYSRAIYILSSGKLNETTVFLGCDVIDPQIIQNQRNMMTELQAVVEKYRKLNALVDVHNRGWDTKFRPQNFQNGGAARTNYFAHAQRSQCEQNVLEFCR